MHFRIPAERLIYFVATPCLLTALGYTEAQIAEVTTAIRQAVLTSFGMSIAVRARFDKL